MSQPDLKPTKSMVVQKPKNSVYNTLLGISAFAIFIGCLLLFWEITTYSGGSYGFSAIYDAVRGPTK